MKLHATLIFAATTLLGAGFAAHAAAADETAPYGKRLTSTEAVAKSRAGSFDVYIDAPTGFAFVNTPAGWKFTRQVPETRIVNAEQRDTKLARY